VVVGIVFPNRQSVLPASSLFGGFESGDREGERQREEDLSFKTRSARSRSSRTLSVTAAEDCLSESSLSLRVKFTTRVRSTWPAGS
jgi:hypothetical protein